MVDLVLTESGTCISRRLDIVTQLIPVDSSHKVCTGLLSGIVYFYLVYATLPGRTQSYCPIVLHI